jgi:hypothetical protein
MLGAVAGDIIGSVYGVSPIETRRFTFFHPFCRYTDDTVLSPAVAKAWMEDRDYARCFRELGRLRPRACCRAAFPKRVESFQPQTLGELGERRCHEVQRRGDGLPNREGGPGRGCLHDRCNS